MRYLGLIIIPIAFAASAVAAELPVTETPEASLALAVVPDSLVVSPDSTRVALAANAGNVVLADKGVFIGDAPVDPNEDSAAAAVEPIRLYLDDKSGAEFEQMTRAVFSPDSRQVAFAGQRLKKWHVVADNRTLTSDADEVPPVPVVFSPDSRTVAWAVRNGGRFSVTVGETHWPAIDGDLLGTMVFSPDSKHVAVAARRSGEWGLYVDGKLLPRPDPPAGGTGRRGGAPPRLARLEQLCWRPDSAAVAYDADDADMPWVCVMQGTDGKIVYASPGEQSLMGKPMLFSADGTHFAFEAAEKRNTWALLVDGTVIGGTWEQVLPEALAFVGATENGAGAGLVALVRGRDGWKLLMNGQPTADAFDSIIEETFVISPDRLHFAFAAMRRGRAEIIRDGKIVATHDGAVGNTFAFSPDSRHLAYGAKNGGTCCACVDGDDGAPFAALGATPIAFSPDSRRIAYDASAGDHRWHLVVGRDAAEVSREFYGFLKGARVVWRADGSVVTIAIDKKVAVRVEAKP